MSPRPPDHRPSAASESPTLAVIGGGLAGLAAAVAAVDRGFRVELFEQARFLGGRAGSFVDSSTGMLVDRCQHVALGCCDEFLAFCGRTGVLDCFEAIDTYHFIAPDGRRFDLNPARWLPGPWRLLPGLLRMEYLSWHERWGIVRALRRLARRFPPPQTPRHCNGGATDEELENAAATFGDWLRHQRQSSGAIEGFWSPIVLSTLGETVGRASLAAVEKVFRDGFLSSRRASRLLLPRRPLREIFHARMGQWLADHGVVCHLGCPVLRIEGDAKRASGLALQDGSRRPFQGVIVAVPWHDVRRLLADELLAAIPALAGVDEIEPAAITAVHLWFDRPAIPLAQAALVGRLGQWVFARPCGAGEAQQHCQVVVSASHRVGPYRHGEWVAQILAELGGIWPEVQEARLVNSRVVSQPAALFSARPGAERLRPPQQTPIPNLALAGDWTATGWPATMESAVRSGRRAVEELLKDEG